MENVYFIPDVELIAIVGRKMAFWRLKQDMTQRDCAERAGVSLSSVQKVERGEPVSVSVMLRLLRTLRKLECIEFFMTEERIGPMEYYMSGGKVEPRRRASRKK